MEHLEYIDNFFTEAPNAEEKQAFEQRILQDPAFAEEVAFYVSTRGLALDQANAGKKKRFRELYDEQPPVKRMGQLRKMISYAAAAAVVAAALLVWFIHRQEANPRQLASKYVEAQFQTLGVTMGSGEDSLQLAVRSFNDQNLEGSLVQFEAIVARDPHNISAVKYAGIACLRLGEYDKALTYFRQLENERGLYANPGKFYQALTLMERNHDGDTSAAKKLLREVKDQKLEGRELAEE